jgi:hypothetical protein
MNRLVYIPKFADLSGATQLDYSQAQFVQAWGVILDNCKFQLLHCDPPAEIVTCGEPAFALFGEEEDQLVDVSADDTTVPDAVWAALAQYTLTGELEGSN